MKTTFKLFNHTFSKCKQKITTQTRVVLLFLCVPVLYARSLSPFVYIHYLQLSAPSLFSYRSFPALPGTPHHDIPGRSSFLSPCSNTLEQSTHPHSSGTFIEYINLYANLNSLIIALRNVFHLLSYTFCYTAVNFVKQL